MPIARTQHVDLAKKQRMNQRIALNRRAPPLGWLTRAGTLVALAALLQVAWRTIAATHAQRMASRPAALPEPLQVWEDEGGQNQMPDAPPARPKEATVPAA
jgi:hypothetical protein